MTSTRSGWPEARRAATVYSPDGPGTDDGDAGIVHRSLSAVTLVGGD